MSTLTKFSAIPYTGPAPTNRDPYVPANATQADARGEEIAAKINNPAVQQERGQDMATFVVDKNAITDVLTALKNNGFTLPLDLFGADYPDRKSGRFDVVYQLYSLQNNERVRLKVRVAEDEAIPTSTKVFKA